MNTTSDQAQQGPSSKNRRIWTKIRNGLKSAWIRTLPAPLTRAGAAIGILVLLGLFVAQFGLYVRPGLPGILDSLAGAEEKKAAGQQKKPLRLSLELITSDGTK